MPSRRSKSIRNVLVVLALAAAAVLAVVVARFLSRPPAVEVARVVRQDVVRTLAVTGRIEPRFTNTVQPLVAGRLTALTGQEGDSVHAGEVLARIDDREERAAVDEALASLAARREQLEQDRRELARARALFTRGLLAEQALEEDSLGVEEGERTVRELEERVTQARVRLDRTVLRAPYEGVILERPVDPGQELAVGDVVYRVATRGERIVEAEVDEQFLGDLAVGMAAEVSPLDRSGEIYPAVIEYIGNRVNQETGAATVRFRFEEAPPPLPAGLSVDVNVTVDRHPDAVTVPRIAVVDPARNSWVLLAVDGVTRRQAVTVIDWQARDIVATAGLSPGDLVVLAPRQTGEGMEIRPRVVDGDGGSPTSPSLLED